MILKIELFKLLPTIGRSHYVTQLTPSKTCLPLKVFQQSCGRYALALQLQESSQPLSLKYIKCPSGRLLLFPNESMGLIAALEWNATPWIKKDARHSRPLTSLYFRADELEPTDLQKRAECIQKLCSFFITDGLLHWEHHETNEKLALRMQKHWQPILDKFQINMNLPHIAKSHHFAGNTLNDSVTRIISSELGKSDSLDLALIEMLTHEYTSIILSMSVIKGWIDSKEAIRAALLEQSYQSEYWGLNDESHGLELSRLEQSTALALMVSRFK